MNYARFVERGRETWEEASRLLTSTRERGLRSISLGELEQLVALHRRVVSDFSFARTHFPGTEAERRLRAVAFAGHRTLAGREQPLLRRIGRFLRRDYPRIFRRELPVVGVSLAIFLAMAVLGAVVTLMDPSFAGLFLDAETLERVRRGDLWVESITRCAPASALSGEIFTNNMSVALFAWAGGALFGLGTLWALAMNGLMLGSILGLVRLYGLSDRLLAFIAAHGPLEIFLVIVAGAAGLRLGYGTLAAANRPRAAVFSDAAWRSVRLVLGTLPWFVLLGLIEGYVSTSDAISPAWKAITGVAVLFTFLAWALAPPPTPRNAP